MDISRNQMRKYGVMAAVAVVLAWIVWPAKEPYMTPEQAVELCGQYDADIEDELYALGEDDSPVGPQARLDGYAGAARSGDDGDELLSLLRTRLADAERARDERARCVGEMRSLSDAVYSSEEGLQRAVARFEGRGAEVERFSKVMVDSYALASQAVEDAGRRAAQDAADAAKRCAEQAELCVEAAALVRKRLPEIDGCVEACVADGNSSEAAAILQSYADSLEDWALGYEKMKGEFLAQASPAEDAAATLWVTDAAGVPQLNEANQKARECKSVLFELKALSLSEAGELPAAPSKLELPPVPPPPAPPAKPDLVIAATGDLPEALLRPLLDGWAKGVGSVSSAEEDGLLVYDIPGCRLGAEAGKFRVRMVAADGEKAFSSLTDGKADMLLTGRMVAGQMLEDWNAALAQSRPSLAGDANVSKRMAHVAYDALIFFGGSKEYSNGLSLREIISSRKLFCIGRCDGGRGEAAAVCGLAKQGQDVVQDADAAAVSTDDLLRRSMELDAICVGVYHSDISWLPSSTSAIASAVEGNLKELPQRLKRRVIAVRGNKDGDVITPPTHDTISSGDYTYTYRINLFNANGNEASCSLMEYVLSAPAQQIVEQCHFVSSRVMSGRVSRLRSDVLPVEEVADLLGADYGYSSKDACLYGVRMPDKLSVHFDFKSKLLPPFAIHQDNSKLLGETVAEFLKLSPEAAVVFVGHADCVYQGRVNYSNLSFNENRKLSLARAATVMDFYGGQAALQGKPLRMETVGASWLYPRRYVDSAKPLEEQQASLADCRRVEIFIIVPKEVGEGLLADAPRS